MRGNELLDKMSLIDPTYIEGAEALPRRRRSNFIKRYGAIAACLVLLISVGFGTYAYAAEAKEYNDAVLFFNSNGLPLEGLTRKEIKLVYRDITTETFSYTKTGWVIVNSLTSEQIAGVEIPQDDPTSEDIRNLWNYKYNCEDLLPEDIRSATQYGVFNGVYVVDISNAPQIAVTGFERLEGYYFPTPNRDYLDVFNSEDGKYYSLTEAFKKGLLTVDNIKTINEKYVKLHSKYYEKDSVGGGELSIGIGENYDIYVDMKFTTTGISEGNPISEIEVAGYIFKVLQDELITITYNRTEYTLLEAYEAKIISDKDVADIYEMWTYAKY